MSENGHSWRSGFVAIGLSIVVLLLIVLFIVSIYEAASGAEGKIGLLRDPQIIAVAIGLIASVLFVERWRSLEAKVDRLTNDQRDALDRLQKSVEADFRRQLKQTVSNAETLNAKITEIVERHPWLEVITDRDIFVETNSVRGILRTCYSFLSEQKLLHLYEYLEYNAKKGTSRDPRKDNDKDFLHGSPDDFAELADFCEIWLEDYYLSSQFLARFSEQSPAGGSILITTYLQKLVRIGDIAAARNIAESIENQLLGRGIWDRLLILVRWKKPVSQKFRWSAQNALALMYASISDPVKADTHFTSAKKSSYSQIFQLQQQFTQLELFVHKGDYQSAQSTFADLEPHIKSSRQLRDAIYLATQLGDLEKALSYRERLMELRQHVFGDVERKSSDTQETDEFTNEAEDDTTTDSTATKRREKNFEAEVDPTKHEKSRGDGADYRGRDGADDGREGLSR